MFVAIFITNDDHSIARWFEIPTKEFTQEIEDKIFSKGYGYSEHYEGDVKIHEKNELKKLEKFLS